MKLAEKLVQVMKTIESVPKNGRNDFHGYEYAQEVDILRAVRGKLADLGVLLLTSVEAANRQDTVTEVSTKHTFIDAESGETLEVKGYGQGADKGDKGGYKAITGALKYLITKTFLIPTGDDPEKDAEPPANQGGRQPSPATNGKPPVRPAASRVPDASTPYQQNQIKKLAGESTLDLQKDIMEKLKLPWPPNKETADRILRRLNEKKQQAATGTK